jgi:hypothetical protein
VLAENLEQMIVTSGVLGPFEAIVGGNGSLQSMQNELVLGGYFPMLSSPSIIFQLLRKFLVLCYMRKVPVVDVADLLA